MTNNSNPYKGKEDRKGNNPDSLKIRKRTFVISILIISIIVGCLITASVFSSSLFTISWTHAQQTPSSVPSSQPQQPSSQPSSPHGKSGTASGKSGMAPGQTGNNPGQSGNTPGQSGSPPPGQSGNTPGQSGSAPGQQCTFSIDCDQTNGPQFCNEQGQCVPGECGDDFDCGAGELCDSTTHLCVSGCRTDENCRLGERCTSISGGGVGECTPIGDFCTDQSDCPSGAVCINEISQCQCSDPTKEIKGGQCQCPTGTTDCGTSTNACTNFLSTAHCGACNNQCPLGAACVQSATGIGCRCPAGQVALPDGRCGPCPKEGQVPQPDGTCACPTGTHEGTKLGQPACVPDCKIQGQTNDPTTGLCGCFLGPGTFPEICGSMCVDTAHDENNCGGCANADGEICDAGEICNNGSCTCAPGQTMCNGQCVNTQTSSNNCGACGNSCASGQTCTNGQCVGTTCEPGFSFDSACNTCTRNCSGDTVLVSGNACLPRCQPLNGFCFVATGPTTYKKCSIGPNGEPNLNNCFQSDVSRCTFGVPSPFP